MSEIVLDQVEFSYLPGVRSVFTSLDLSAGGPRVFSLIGSNGAGKTTFLNLIAGLLRPSKGEIRTTQTTGQKTSYGYVWQDFRASLFPWLSAMENIQYPLRVAGSNSQEIEKITSELFGRFDWQLDWRKRTWELSGGEQQFVCLLRALIGSPDILLLDEPFAAIDIGKKWRLIESVDKLVSEKRSLTFFVSHDLDETLYLADEIIILTPGAGADHERIINHVPRPRLIESLTSAESVRLRASLLKNFTPPTSSKGRNR